MPMQCGTGLQRHLERVGGMMDKDYFKNHYAQAIDEAAKSSFTGSIVFELDLRNGGIGRMSIKKTQVYTQANAPEKIQRVSRNG